MGIGRTPRGGVVLNMHVEHSIPVDQWAKKGVQKVREHAAEDLMAITEDVMIIAKSIVHVLTGTLRNSIKVDRPGDVRERTVEAETRDLGYPIPQPQRDSEHRMSLAVGGTTFYAVYEELRHPYMEPAVLVAKADFSRHASR